GTTRRTNTPQNSSSVAIDTVATPTAAPSIPSRRTPHHAATATNGRLTALDNITGHVVPRDTITCPQCVNTNRIAASVVNTWNANNAPSHFSPSSTSSNHSPSIHIIHTGMNANSAA